MDQFLLLAQNEEDVVFIVIMVVAVIIGLAIGLAISAFICWIISKAVAAIPPQHREIEPGSVWLLMIPCFNIIWNFFVFPKVSASFQRYFASVGNHNNGDCGAQLSLWYCICTVLQIIPLVNYIAGPASLILLIICLVKFWDYKGQAERIGPGTGMNPAYASPGAPMKKVDPTNPYA